MSTTQSPPPTTMQPPSKPILEPPPRHILPEPTLTSLCTSWLHEDTPTFDPASAALPATPITATLYAKSTFLLAGTPFVDTLFRLSSCSIVWHQREGSFIRATGTSKLPLATIKGGAPGLLRAERPALNALAECSGVATAAFRAAEVKRSTAWAGCLAATRKTTPGLRLLQKYGVIVGGMDPHRMDLSSMAMLKDNHIAAAGSVERAVSAARRVLGFAGRVEVEAGCLGEAVAACEAGADVVMLDNFDGGSVGDVAFELKERFPKVLVEVSGGVEIDGLRGVLVDCVDVVSFSVFKFREMVDVSLTVE